MTTCRTVSSLLENAAGRFESRGIPSPQMEAEYVLSHVLGCPRLSLHLKGNDPVKKDLCEKFEKIISLRQKRRPLALILGEKEFMGLRFIVNQDTLVPRPETEHLVEAYVRVVAKKEGQVIADMCTGSGCVAVSIAVLSKPKKIFACDMSREALRIAQKNIEMHKVGKTVVPLQGDLFDALGKKYIGSLDAVISNPPYVAQNEFAELEPELSFEPRIALDGGKDGLDFYRRLAWDGKRYLKKGGYLILELSSDRSSAIADIVEREGFFIEELIKDYAGLDRVLISKLRQL